jgi:site-specific DNA recombinase
MSKSIVPNGKPQKQAASSHRLGLVPAAIYARVSTEDQGKGYSISTQIEACQALARREGYTVPEIYVLSDDLSGTTMERPGLRQLRELIQTHAITAIIVYDPDRLSRNLGHQLLLAEELEQAAVTLLIVSHPLEQGPEGWLFFQMRGALAEYERAKILERTARGRLGRAKAGHTWGGQVPLGYRAIREPHKARWEVDDEEAAVVRQIYALCLSGKSAREIARLLTDKRIPTRLDRRQEDGGRKARAVGIWEPKSVYNILTNEAYIGIASFGKRQPVTPTTRRVRPPEEWTAIPVPPIVERTTFEGVQVQLANNKRLARRNRTHEYLLIGGRFRCGRCGRTMSGKVARNRRRYRCASAYALDHERGCPGSLPAEEVEGRVWSAVAEMLRHPEIIAKEVQRQHAQADQERAAVQKELALFDKALAKCDREDQRWAEAYANEVIRLEELKQFRAEIAVRRQSVLGQRAAVQAKLETIAHAVDQVDTLLDYCARVRESLHTFDMGEKRLALEALDIRVTWTAAKELDIEGRIPLEPIVGSVSRSCT